MKNNRPSQQSAELQHRRKQLDKLLSYVESRAQAVLRKHGRLYPALYAVSPDGLCLWIAPSREESEKNAHAYDARIICDALGTTVAVLASEARVLFAKPGQQADLEIPPSQSPDRKEYVSLIGEALGGIHQNRLLPILRDDRGRVSSLGKSAVLPPKPVVGRDAPLMPQAPVPSDDRDLATMLLASRGLIIRKESFKL